MAATSKGTDYTYRVYPVQYLGSTTVPPNSFHSKIRVPTPGMGDEAPIAGKKVTVAAS